MAKASEADQELAREFLAKLESLSESGHLYNFTEAERLIQLAERAIPALNRVIWGYVVLTDSRNQVVNPDADVLEFHPRFAAMEAEIATLREQLENLRPII
jgi:hypothetical protein